MNTRQFIPTHIEDTFQVGLLEGETHPGVYLSPAYLDRLREITYAAALRLDASSADAIPDALKNLFGVVTRLTQIHAKHLSADGYPWTEADRAEAAAAKAQLEEALRSLRGFRRDPDDPDDA